MALVQLHLGSFDGSSHAPLLYDQGSNFSVHVIIPLELSCDSPVLLGSGIIVHGNVCGVIGEGFEEPVGKFPFFVDGNALRWEQLVLVDGFVDANGAQAVQPILFDVGGKDMDGVIAVSDWDKEIKDVSFILFIPLWPSCLPIPVSEPFVIVCLPVLVCFFQVSCMHLTLCQILSSLAEYFQLFLIVVADFLILSCNSCQSLCNEEEFFSSRGAVSFEGSAH